MYYVHAYVHVHALLHTNAIGNISSVKLCLQTHTHRSRVGESQFVGEGERLILYTSTINKYILWDTCTQNIKILCKRETEN